MRFLCGARRLLSVATVVLVASTDVRAQTVPDDFVITLQRTACFGTCPSYKVSVDSAGRVTYDGSEFVRVKGRQDTRVPLSGVAALVATVDRIGFFELDDSYAAPVTDHPTVFVTVRSGGRTKRISDYVSGPKDLKTLEQQIDEVAGTRRWIRIDVAALDDLVLKGPPPSREQLDELLLGAIQHDDLDVAKALLDLGASPEGAASRSRPLLTSATSAAAVRLLVGAGADAFVLTGDGDTLLDDVVRYAAPDVARGLLEAGVPASQRALVRAACRGNLSIVTLLLRAGANPSLAVEGTTPVECARSRREFSRLLQGTGHEQPDQDYDGVVAALERAAASRDRR